MAATLRLLLGTATACPGYSSGPGKDSTLALWPLAHRGLPVGQGMRGEGGVSREPRLTAGLWQPSLLGTHMNILDSSGQGASGDTALTWPPSSCTVLMPAFSRKPPRHLPLAQLSNQQGDLSTIASTSCRDRQGQEKCWRTPRFLNPHRNS